MDLLGLQALGFENGTLLLHVVGGATVKFKIPENARLWLATPVAVQRLSPALLDNMCRGLIVEEYVENDHMILGGSTATHKIIIEFIPHKQMPQVNLIGSNESISSRAGNMTYAPSKQWEDEAAKASKLIEEEGKKGFR